MDVRGGVKENCRRNEHFPTFAGSNARWSAAVPECLEDARPLSGGGANAIEQSLHARLMSRPMRALSGGLLLGVGLAVLPAWAATESAKPATPVTVTVPSTAPEAAPPAAPKVRYENDKVWVEARDADLGEILKALAKASGADLVGAPRAGGPVTITLEPTTLTDPGPFGGRNAAKYGAVPPDIVKVGAFPTQVLSV